MADSPVEDEHITKLLRSWNAGEPAALDKLAPLVYRELHRLAVGYMGRERPGHTLQATALVHEAYVRLIDWQRVPWQNRSLCPADRLAEGPLAESSAFFRSVGASNASSSRRLRTIPLV